jgi:hypothetical protein
VFDAEVQALARWCAENGRTGEAPVRDDSASDGNRRALHAP